MFKSTGILIYDPVRDRFKGDKSWRCVLKIHRDLARYYRFLVKKNTGIILNVPSWESHITIIKKEIPPNNNLWGIDNRKKIIFRYDHDIQICGTDGNNHTLPYKYWWLNVYSEELNEVRINLGLNGKKDNKFHITIGILY